MENVLNFLAEYSTAIHIIAAIGFIGIGVMIARSMPPKKPKSYGELHIIHYANDSKQLYLKLEDDTYPQYLLQQRSKELLGKVSL